MCNASGQCVAPDALPCPPFACNVNKCFTACTTDAQCVAPNTCIDNSCGLKANGASCTIANECKSGFCAQGVCCDQACTGACRSCVAGVLGACSNVATGTVDPEARCADQGGASCGTNARCEAGRLPALRLGDALPRPDLSDDDQPVHGAVDVQRRRRLRHAGSDQLLPVPVRHERVQAFVHPRRPVQAARDLRQRDVRAQAAGRGLLRARRSA